MEAHAHDAPGTDFSTVLLAESAAGNIEVVKLVDLNVDPSYQRDLSRELVDKIKAGWDPAAAGPVVVSRRVNGSLWVVNGQHRVAAALELAGEGKMSGEIVAQVLNGLDAKQEAELRLMGNTRRSDSAQERFRAQLAAGHEESLRIMEICANFNTRVNPNPDLRAGINSVSAVENIFRIDQGMLLTRVFEIIQEAYGHVGGHNVSVAMLKGVAWFLTKHSHESDRRRFVERLQSESLDGVDRKARNYKAASGGALWMNYYRTFVELYNYRLGDTQKLEIKTGGWSKSGGDSWSG